LFFFASVRISLPHRYFSFTCNFLEFLWDTDSGKMSQIEIVFPLNSLNWKKAPPINNKLSHRNMDRRSPIPFKKWHIPKMNVLTEDTIATIWINTSLLYYLCLCHKMHLLCIFFSLIVALTWPAALQPAVSALSCLISILPDI